MLMCFYKTKILHILSSVCLSVDSSISTYSSIFAARIMCVVDFSKLTAQEMEFFNFTNFNITKVLIPTPTPTCVKYAKSIVHFIIYFNIMNCHRISIGIEHVSLISIIHTFPRISYILYDSICRSIISKIQC